MFSWKMELHSVVVTEPPNPERYNISRVLRMSGFASHTFFRVLYRRRVAELYSAALEDDLPSDCNVSKD